MYKSIARVILLAGAIGLTLTALPACNNAQADENQAQTEVAKSTFKPLLARKGMLAQDPEWPAVQKKVADLFEKIRKDPNDIKSKQYLALAYMDEARVTGEHPYYYPATLEIVDDILSRAPENFEALAFKASVLMSQHDFAKAKEVAEKAISVNGYNAFIYGVLTDANVELGLYDKAIESSDKMQAIRPGYDSYARVSYLREIYGDYPGAKEAMELAVNAAVPGTESHSWLQTNLGKLYEITGEPEKAAILYKDVLEKRPSYTFAMAGLASLAATEGKTDSALAILQRAAEILPEYSYNEKMAELYQIRGEDAKAAKAIDETIAMLQEDIESGHIANLDIAKVYAMKGDYPNAIKNALSEYQRRPDNIEVNNALAWIYYQSGDVASAQKHIKIAMHTGSKNAEMLARAAVIAASAGNKTEARALLARSKKINPYMDAPLAAEVKKTIG